MSKLWTARDNAHVDEIITHLSRLEADYHLDLAKEKDWLNSLTEKCRDHYQAGYMHAVKHVLRATLDNLDDNEKEEIISKLNKGEIWL